MYYHLYLFVLQGDASGIEPEPRARPCPSAIDGIRHMCRASKIGPAKKAIPSHCSAYVAGVTAGSSITPLAAGEGGKGRRLKRRMNEEQRYALSDVPLHYSYCNTAKAPKPPDLIFSQKFFIDMLSWIPLILFPYHFRHPCPAQPLIDP